MSKEARGYSRAITPTRLGAAVVCLALTAAGCSELRGRRRIREGNRLYRDGLYAQALQQYSAAERFVPHLHQLWIGKGLTCRQMMTPGAKTPENERAVDCALNAFEHLQQVERGDSRGETLYLQTLFDAERYETLAKFYSERLRKDPTDLAAVNGQIQAYSRWNHMDEALAAYQRRAEMRPDDAEAQYAVGVYIWQQLYLRGGGSDKASFDPRPDPNAPSAAAAKAHKGKTKKQKKQKQQKQKQKQKQAEPKVAKQVPVFGPGDITGEKRIALAELGIKYLERAMALRPHYREAMAYVNLLLRQKSMAYFSQPAEWQACVDAAEKWRTKAEAEYAKGGPASR